MKAKIWGSKFYFFSRGTLGQNSMFTEKGVKILYFFPVPWKRGVKTAEPTNQLHWSPPGPATGTLRSWSARHQFDACTSRWCPTDANPSVPMVRAVSTFSFVLNEEMKTSVEIPEEVALSNWSPYICYDFFYFSYWFCWGSISIYKT